jgi:hypothetical protein
MKSGWAIKAHPDFRSWDAAGFVRKPDDEIWWIFAAAARRHVCWVCQPLEFFPHASFSGAGHPVQPAVKALFHLTGDFDLIDLNKEIL